MSDESEESAAGAVVRVKYRSQTPEAFAVEHGGDLSADGIFIKTKDPLALGRPLRLQLMLADGERVISGTGRVRFRRLQAGAQPPGMGIEFVELDVASRRLVDAIVSGRRGAASRYDDREHAEVLAPSHPPARPRASSMPPGLFRGGDMDTAVGSGSPSSRPPMVRGSTPSISGLFSSMPPPPAAEAPLGLAPQQESGGFFASEPPPAHWSAPPPRQSSHPPSPLASDERNSGLPAAVQQSSVPPPLPSQRTEQAQDASADRGPTTQALAGLFDDITLIGSDRPGSPSPDSEALDASVFADSDAEGSAAETTLGSGRPTATSLVGLEGRLTLPESSTARRSRLGFILLLVVLAAVGFFAAFVVASGGAIPTPDQALKLLQDLLAGRAGSTSAP